jgi:hypothetical protein
VAVSKETLQVLAKLSFKFLVGKTIYCLLLNYKNVSIYLRRQRSSVVYIILLFSPLYSEKGAEVYILVCTFKDNNRILCKVGATFFSVYKEESI